MTIIRRVVSAARPTVDTLFETWSTELTNTVDTFWVSEQLRRSAKGRIAITSAGSIDCGRRFGGLGVVVHAYGAEFSPEPGFQFKTAKTRGAARFAPRVVEVCGTLGMAEQQGGHGSTMSMGDNTDECIEGKHLVEL